MLIRNSLKDDFIIFYKVAELSFQANGRKYYILGPGAEYGAGGAQETLRLGVRSQGQSAECPVTRNVLSPARNGPREERGGASSLP